jgi:hypothetical protein
VVTAVVVALGVLGCGDKSKWVEERQKKIDAYRDGKTGAVTASSANATVDAFWDNASHVKVRHERECPEGMWALFQGSKAPGNTDEAKARNEARRTEYSDRMKVATFTTTIQLGTGAGMKVGDYDMQSGGSTVELPGLIDCTDSAGRIAIAFGSAQPVLAPKSAVEHATDMQISLWGASPLKQTVKMPVELAKEFREQKRVDMEARIVFRFVSTDVHTRMVKVTRGELEDWGAGRLIKATVEAVRITTEKDRLTLLDTRSKSVATANPQ